MSFSEKNLKDLAELALDNKASDIHIREGEPPSFRIMGDLVPIRAKNLTVDVIQDICSILMADNPDQLDNLDKLSEADGSYDIKNTCRLRYNFYRFQQKIGIIIRIIKYGVPSIDELGLTARLKKIARQRRGLILVTGATGSGKSTTLAAIINEINETRHAHILTIEDPIEFIHPQINSRISQREIGRDTDNFTDALRSALRQDPDVILIGELRDPETISIAMKAAETGHVVFATVHTTDALSTISRIISMFPSTEQEYARKRLADSLFATISQRMLKGRNEDVVVAQEIMVTSPGIRECIEGKEDLVNIYKFLANQEGHANEIGQSFDSHLMRLYRRRRISKETALEAASSQSDFVQKLVLDEG